MGLWLVPKSVTFNNLEQRNGLILRYFAEFGIFLGPVRKSGWLAINRFFPEKCRKVHQL